MIVWGGSYRSRSASGSHPARALAAGIRRLAATDRAVLLFTNRRRPVTLSEHAATLDALAQLHQIATDARLPRAGVSPQDASVALTFGQGVSVRRLPPCHPRSLADARQGKAER